VHIATYQPSAIYPDVLPLTATDYADGVRAFIEQFLARGFEDAAIYQFGQMRHPGISDVDLLIVTRDAEWRQAREAARAIARSSRLLEYLFVHAPDVVGESILPHLFVLHSQIESRLLYGARDPLAAVEPPCWDTGVALIQNVTWDSCHRIDCLNMNAVPVGLRHVLYVLHHLLLTAQRGNELLDAPVSISLATEPIRQEILRAAPEAREALCRRFIAESVTLLNTVDARLDRQLLGSLPPAPLVTVASHCHFCVAPLDAPLDTAARWFDRIWGGAQIARTPLYLSVFTAALARRLSAYLPDFSMFRLPPEYEAAAETIDTSLYARHLAQAIELCHRFRVDYCFPLPFGLHGGCSLRQRLMRSLRRQALARHLRN